MPHDISIVIPAYNPAERTFSRVLAAVEPLCAQSDSRVECVIVDNNSNPPLREMRCVREFLRNRANACLVREEAQGLTFARLAGIRATSAPVIVVFDDDNVPSPDYLQVVTRVMQAYPFVGVWGPGSVDVELLDPVPASLQQRVKAHHGQKRIGSVQYAMVPSTWYDFYPIGMGQVILRDVAESYRRAVESGQLSATDRSGGSLASAGDSQIVWQAINLGLAAGVHPDLKLLHLIPGSRSTIKYLRRLMFGCASSHYRARAQSFPQEAEALRRSVPSLARYGIQVSKVLMLSASRNRLRFLSIDLAELLGEWCGHLSVAGREKHWTFALARRLGLA
jgi:glycosyltransferase involved in cell wall biosynthesis